MADRWSRIRRLKTDFVVDRVSEPLLAAEVAFRCLNADVTEQQLNLFKPLACLMTQTGAGARQIVRHRGRQLPGHLGDCAGAIQRLAPIVPAGSDALPSFP